MSQLTDRLRTIVGTPGRSHALAAPPARPAAPALESVLGGGWHQSGGGACFIVERRQEPSTRHGRETVGQIAARLDEASGEASLLARGAPIRTPFVFFDLETTGLNGGAGTHAFLVGCGWFERGGGFVTRQFILARFADERPMLVAVADELGRAGALVSFNGKSFDAPLLETRYLFHRLDWIGGRTPHLDVLHPARRFWGWAPLEGDGDCSLMALERRVLEARRSGDVPGFEIPSRYFQFVRSGDAKPLAAVLEHNRQDLLSLAGVTARLLQLVRVGPSDARDAREVLALGRVYARAGLESRAIDAYQHAVTKTTGTSHRGGAMPHGGAFMAHGGAFMAPIKIDALRSLALAFRRARRFEDAAGAWRDLLDLPGCPRQIAREANEALAIHHEHRVRDMALAKAFALGSFDDTRPDWNKAVRHRLSRIEKKLGARGAGLEAERVLLDPPTG